MDVFNHLKRIIALNNETAERQKEINQELIHKIREINQEIRQHKEEIEGLNQHHATYHLKDFKINGRVNLNQIFGRGKYFSEETVEIIHYDNLPEGCVYAFSLEVDFPLGSDYYIYQELRIWHTGEIFYRSSDWEDSNTRKWLPWHKVHQSQL